jgi:ATP-dependent Lon protease
MKSYTLPLLLALTLLPSLVHADQESPPSSQDTEEATPNSLLFEAIAQGYTSEVRRHIKEGADVNAPFGDNGDTALIFAVKCLYVLVSHYEQKIFSDPHTFTIAYANRLAIIRYLIFHPDVDCNAKNYQGETALTLATQEGLNQVVELLINNIQLNNLHGSTDEASTYKEMLAELDISEEIRTKIEEAIEKSSNVGAYEAGKHIEYLKFIFSLPWDKKTETTNSLPAVEQALEEDHYGLKEVKDRVLEHIALSLITPQPKAKILCLVGPPGTGKTSIARSIAKGLNRKFEKISLGGVHEERAIRGHNRAYIGAEPGDILKGLKNAESKNCVILLDEIDKLGTQNQWSGNPAAALLEVLDREQNNRFLDHYLDIPFDLSEVFFITTANYGNDIPWALRDRLEIIELSSYTDQEKFNIAKKFFIPKALIASGLGDKGFTIADDTLEAIIDGYTFEAGVRKLEEIINTLCGKAARQFLEKGTMPQFTPENLVEYLGAGMDRGIEKEFTKQNSIGVSNAIYVAKMGGVKIKGGLNFIETTIMPGKRGTLSLTGNLGNTWQESAKIARSYARAHAQEIGIGNINFDEYEIHIHTIPSDGMDGPSAGAAILSSIVSALSKKPFNSSYAMTGELSLTGKILPIGGLKEKLLAAKKSGIKKVIIPQGNVPDLVELRDIIKDMEIIPVSYAHEVLEKVLLPK